MAVRGKSISLYLMDGESNGRIKCSLTNWTGVAYKIPRTEIENSKNIEHLNHNGVYFLFGTSNEGEEVVYIGQARTRKNGNGLLGRIMEPHPTIDYWTDAVMITTRDDYFGPTEISYPEMKKLKKEGPIDVRHLKFNVQYYEAALRFFGIAYNHEKMNEMFSSKKSYLTCRDKIVHGLDMESIKQVLSNYDQMVATMQELLDNVAVAE